MESSSEQRLDHLMDLSQQLYPVIESQKCGERRARRSLRLGMGTVAAAFRRRESLSAAGNRYHRLLLQQFEAEGFSVAATEYQPFPAYRQGIRQLPNMSPFHDSSLDELAHRYADEQRRTQRADGTWESDAEHVVHLTGLALPYAAEYQPQLDQGKIALYSLVHDVVEAYAGDTPSLGISAAERAAKDQREQAGLEQLSHDYQPSHPAFVAAVMAYEQLAEPEARYVKTFDKLDPWFTHFNNDGRSLVTHYQLTSREQFLAQCARNHRHDDL